ncbi:MAG: hypothetical protein QME50_05720 [Candidatus Bathyarchaeota archaeon]|nr:hypothetical protein [Candidatus Bathyarchaeota archaeon]MDI6806032.1 hypothetical protein [Candidatus Bathyarchaeia archaeon]
MFTIGAECSRCGEVYPPDNILTVCPKCGGAFLFQYDLAKVAGKVSKRDLENREDTFWKFRELLPLSSPNNIVSLGEPYTPILQFQRGNKAVSKSF